MQLYITWRSHFSRKVRLLVDHLHLDHTLTDIGNVAANTTGPFKGNPAMSVPVFEDDKVWLIESDHIASYIATTYDKPDSYDVLTKDSEILNMRAVMNSVMANDVKLVLAARTGLNPDVHAFFQKAKLSIITSLVWMEKRADMLSPADPAYLDFHFISLWDHLKLYDLVRLDYPALQSAAEILHRQELISKSAPPPFE